MMRFQCRTRLCGWCSRMNSTAVDVMATFQCRTRLCGWCSKLGTVYLSGAIRFQCRTRLCGWCSLVTVSHSASTSLVSMPHAALWVVQHDDDGIDARALLVSMPHAALWVVQRRDVRDTVHQR